MLPASFNLPTLPLFISRVSAGFPSPADDYIERRLNLEEYLVSHPAATFYLKAGRPYPALNILADDLLVVDRSITPKAGHVVVVVESGELRMALIPPKSPELEVWGVVRFVIHSMVGISHVRAD